MGYFTLLLIISNLWDFCESDFERDTDDRKDITNFVFFMGNCVIARSSKK